jgi:hypothetical protein
VKVNAMMTRESLARQGGDRGGLLRFQGQRPEDQRTDRDRAGREDKAAARRRRVNRNARDRAVDERIGHARGAQLRQGGFRQQIVGDVLDDDGGKLGGPAGDGGLCRRGRGLHRDQLAEFVIGAEILPADILRMPFLGAGDQLAGGKARHHAAGAVDGGGLLR